MNTYRRDRSYLWNYRHGPSFRGPFPRLPAGPAKDLLGLRVDSLLGVSAGILLNSRWIECYARLGFDILTYKTVRSAATPCYPLPNWLYVEEGRRGRPAARDGRRGGGDPSPRELVVARRRAARARDVTSAVCFGMPSMAPEVWRADVRRARGLLRRGQVLIVSVVGTPRPGLAARDAAAALAEDYARCARWAAAAGAGIVEANFSCPNVCSAEGSVYQDAGLTSLLAGALRAALPSTPLLIKAGHFETPARLRRFYRAVERLADGVVLVNGMSRRVVRRDGRPAFPGHERVAVLGRAIHAGALENVRGAVALTGRLGIELRTLGVGGVLGVEDAADFLRAGAAVALTGGGAALDPGLARRWKEAYPAW